jgi:hypothetical protein
MPIATTQDFDHDLTVHVATGAITDEEMFGTLEGFYAGRVTRLLLWDMSQADLRTTTADTLRRFVQRAAELGASRSGGKTAVITSTALQYGLARMSEAFARMESAPYEFRAFKSQNEALAWLLPVNNGK